MTKENKDVPGNAVASQAAFTQAMVRVGHTLGAFERTAEGLDDQDFILVKVVVLLPSHKRSDYLVVVNAEDHGRKVVGFHDAPSFTEAVVGALNRLANRTMKFKEDTPYER